METSGSVFIAVSYTHLDVYKRQIGYHALLIRLWDKARSMRIEEAIFRHQNILLVLNM